MAAFAFWTVTEEGAAPGLFGRPTGPSALWLTAVGPFSGGCEAHLPREAWRLVTHQVVAPGALPLAVAVALQLTLGLPLNMVHGSWLVGLAYEGGVVTGGLAFLAVDGGEGSLVGPSGGVAALLGMHAADLVLGWGVPHRGSLSHWQRLGLVAVALALLSCHAVLAASLPGGASGNGPAAALTARCVFPRTNDRKNEPQCTFKYLNSVQLLQ